MTFTKTGITTPLCTWRETLQRSLFSLSLFTKISTNILRITSQLEKLLIPNALCWSSRKCNCACALPAEVQLRLRVTRRSWQKLFAGKNFVKILVTAQTQLRSYSEQQRAFGNSNICNCVINMIDFLIVDLERVKYYRPNRKTLKMLSNSSKYRNFAAGLWFSK